MVIKPKHRKPSWPSSKKSSITCLENQNAHISSSARKNLVCFAGLRRIKSGSPKYKSPLPKMSNLKKVFRFSWRNPLRAVPYFKATAPLLIKSESKLQINFH
jgi:hypothetical protein